MTTYYSNFNPIESADGAKGSAAFLGAISTALVYLYKRSATVLISSDKPNGDVIYTFATGNINISAVSNGWTITIPSGTDPLYVVAGTATSINPTDTIAAAEWSSPVVLAQNGLAGTNAATVFLFQRSTSNTLPAVPSGTATYTFSSGILLSTSTTGNTVTPFLNGWTQSAPDSSLGKYLFVTTATAISTGTIDTILTSEWAASQILAQDGADGTDGTDSYTAYLTNESHTLPASSAGAVSSYAGATGSFIIYKTGTGDISSNFTLSTVSGSNPQALTIGYSGNVYTITGGLDNAEALATITIRATGSGVYSGITIDKVFSLTKSVSGANGTDAKLLNVLADRQVINYTGAGALNPLAQITTFTAYKQNTTGTVNWTISDTLGNVLTPGTYLTAVSGDSTTITAANFTAAISVNSANGIKVTATLTDGITLTDVITIVKVIDGVNGTNGTNAISGLLTNETFTTTSLSNGTGYTLTNSGGTFKVYSGITDVTTSSTFAISDSATLNGLTIAIGAATGIYSLSGILWTSDTESFTLQATYLGTVISKTYKIAKIKTATSGTSPTSYSITPSVNTVRNSGGTLTPASITFNSTSTIGATTPAAYAGRFIIATSTDGSTFTDRYTSTADESSKAYTIPTGTTIVRARLYLAGGVTTQVDQQTVSVVVDGTNGIDGIDGINGTSAVTGYITKDTGLVFTFADGTPTGYTGLNGLFKVFNGITDVSSTATGHTATASGCTGTINIAVNNPVTGPIGYYEVTAMAGDTATLVLSATYSGVTITKTYYLSKVKAGYDIVSTLPSTNLFQGRTVFLTTDNKLYRYNGSAWLASVASTDISGTLTDAQISALAASKVTGTLTDTQLAAISASKITGQIVSTQITDGSISTAKIAAGAITSNEISANTITAADIAASTITATQIAAATITGAKIAAGTIAAGNILANTITASQIAANTITATQLAASTITANEIAAGTITAAKLSTGELITVSAQIGTGVINTANIGDLVVNSAKIADLTVGTAKITGQAVTTTATVTTASDVSATADSTYYTIGTISFAKALGIESILKFEFNLQWYSSDDIRGALYLESAATGTVTYYTKYGATTGTAPLVSRTWTMYINGAGGTMYIPLAFVTTASNISAGTDTYTLKFRKDSGASTVTVKAGSTLAIREEKK